MNSFTVRRIKDPAMLPIELELVKDHLKIANTYEDSLLTSYIRSATRMFENYTGRALIEQSWHVQTKQFTKDSITLPIRPAQKIIEIELVDFQNRSSVFSPKHYELEEGSSELFFKILPLSHALRIKYICGYGLTPEYIPSDITSALLHHISFMYENRDSPMAFNLSYYDQFKNMKV